MTKTTHRFALACTCPVDGSLDIYQAEALVDDGRVLPVERILEAVNAILRGPPHYQEDVTQWLAGELNATVTTWGTHSTVATRCESSP